MKTGTDGLICNEFHWLGLLQDERTERGMRDHVVHHLLSQMRPRDTHHITVSDRTET